MKSLPVIGVVIAALLIIGFLSVFTVKEQEQALVLRFGEAVRTENAWNDTEARAGLKFKLPLAESIVTLDRRNLELNMDEEEIFASDQERLIVDAFVRYRISDPKTFYENFTSRNRAEARLRSIMDQAMRNTLGRVPSSEIISGQRVELMDEIQRTAQSTLTREEGDAGVEIIDVRLRRVDLPVENANRVFERMKTERQQVAQLIRSEGEEKAIEIRANAAREVIVIEANAREEAEKIKGAGDAGRIELEGAIYGRDPDFFEFYRTMVAIERGLEKDTTLIMSPNGDFLGYLDDNNGDGR